MKSKIHTAKELQSIPIAENGEPLILLNEACTDIICEYRRVDSNLKSVLVRKSVADKLCRVQRELAQLSGKMHLLVVEGYRTLAYQEQYFLRRLLLQYKQNADFDELIENTHQFVALPSIAGHPTGGAVDLTIAYEGKEVDMGGAIADFTIPERLPTYSDCISSDQAKMRLLLHDLMIEAGFAPYYGEWWHFSYGDAEWAAFYEKSKTLYSLHTMIESIRLKILYLETNR